MYKVTYELLTEDENGNDVWESVTLSVRERSAEEAVETVKYDLLVVAERQARNFSVK